MNTTTKTKTTSTKLSQLAAKIGTVKPVTENIDAAPTGKKRPSHSKAIAERVADLTCVPEVNDEKAKARIDAFSTGVVDVGAKLKEVAELTRAQQQMAEDGCPTEALTFPAAKRGKAPLAKGASLPRSAPGREIAIPQPKTPQTKAAAEKRARELGLSLGGKARASKPKKEPGKGYTKRSKEAGAPKKGSKLAIVAALLQRKNGCTTAEVLEATGWPAVSMPQQAAAAGLKLVKTKEPGKPTRYTAG